MLQNPLVRHLEHEVQVDAFARHLYCVGVRIAADEFLLAVDRHRAEVLACHARFKGQFYARSLCHVFQRKLARQVCDLLRLAVHLQRYVLVVILQEDGIGFYRLLRNSYFRGCLEIHQVHYTVSQRNGAFEVIDSCCIAVIVSFRPSNRQILLRTVNQSYLHRIRQLQICKSSARARTQGHRSHLCDASVCTYSKWYDFTLAFCVCIIGEVLNANVHAIVIVSAIAGIDANPNIIRTGYLRTFKLCNLGPLYAVIAVITGENLPLLLQLQIGVVACLCILCSLLVVTAFKAHQLKAITAKARMVPSHDGDGLAAVDKRRQCHSLERCGQISTYLYSRCKIFFLQREKDHVLRPLAGILVAVYVARQRNLLDGRSCRIGDVLAILALNCPKIAIQGVFFHLDRDGAGI